MLIFFLIDSYRNYFIIVLGKCNLIDFIVILLFFCLVKFLFYNICLEIKLNRNFIFI